MGSCIGKEDPGGSGVPSSGAVKRTASSTLHDILPPHPRDNSTSGDSSLSPPVDKNQNVSPTANNTFVALFQYDARTDNDLSFKKDDVSVLGTSLSDGILADP